MTAPLRRIRAHCRSGRRTLPRRAQRGFALLIAMLLLALMMLVGAGTLESAIVEQKVAGGMRDRSAAFEGAEAAALQSFAQLRQFVASGVGEPTGTGGRYFGGSLPPADGGSAVDSDNASTRFWRSWGMPEHSTLQTALPESIANVEGVRYVIERLPIDDEGEPSGAATYPLNYSRITVFGKGEGAAEVLIQTTLVTVPK
jgi:type IV pilus assembly protein PilX